VKVRAFDPVAMPKAAKLPALRGVTLCDDAYACATGAHAVAIVTEWNEFRGMDLAKLKRLMKRPILADLRNLYEPEEVEARGWTHLGVGRGRPGAVASRARRSRRAARS
jgi:UDPglucose 6-dehydrogenase